MTTTPTTSILSSVLNALALSSSLHSSMTRMLFTRSSSTVIFLRTTKNLVHPHQSYPMSHVNLSSSLSRCTSFVLPSFSLYPVSTL